MLDKRLVEFALGVLPTQVLLTDRRRSLFRHAMGDLLPSSVEWDTVKNEPVTFAALEREHILAHSEWADHLSSGKAVSPATKFVDPAKIHGAIQSALISGRARDLSGVREAFGFYAIHW